MKFHYREALTPVLLMKFLYSPHPRDVRIWVNTVFILISLKTDIARSVRGPKLQRLRAGRRNGGAVLRAEKFGDLITADHKVLCENCESRSNHRYAVVVQDLATHGSHQIRAKHKLHRKPREACKSSWNPTGNPKVIYTDNSLEFGNVCEDPRLHHTDQKQMGLLKEQCAE